MTRLLFALLLSTGTAWAQPYPTGGPSGAPDVFTLERLEDGYATLTYSNSGDQTSLAGRTELSHNGLEVDAFVSPGGADVNFAERLTVTAPEGWIAVPEEIHVLDGDETVVELFRGGLGM